MVFADEFTHNVSFKTCHLAKWFNMIIIVLPLVEIATVQIKSQRRVGKGGSWVVTVPTG